jgi:hypothetical protein
VQITASTRSIDVDVVPDNDGRRRNAYVKRAAISFSSMVFPFALLLASFAAAQSVPPRKDIPAIAKAANGAIVTIVTKNNDKPIARGTGFLVSADGVIVTNYHVIANGNIAIVKFSDGTVLPVDGVLASDKIRDLAVIKIHGKNFRALALGNSDRMQIGQDVVAIGNPLGFELTVSNGILSGLRTIEKEGGKFLQVTAPISHGSSGGPLFNMAGEVIGITSMFYEGGENLNFAIPVNDAKRLLLNQSVRLQNLPNEPVEAEAEPAAPPVAKVDPSEGRIWTADLIGGEYKIKVERGEIRVSTIRPPIKAACVAYHISQDNFTHDIILDIKDGDNLVGLLDAYMEIVKDGIPSVAKGVPLGLHLVSESQLTGYLVTGFDDKTGELKSMPITFTSNDLVLSNSRTTAIPQEYLKNVTAPLMVITYMYDAAKRGVPNGMTPNPDRFRESVNDFWDPLPKEYKLAFVAVLTRVESAQPPWPDANEISSLVEAEVKKSGKVDSDAPILVVDYMFECAKRESADGKISNPDVVLEAVNKFWRQRNSENKTAWIAVLEKVESATPPWPPLHEVMRLVDEQAKRNHRGTQ